MRGIGSSGNKNNKSGYLPLATSSDHHAPDEQLITPMSPEEVEAEARLRLGMDDIQGALTHANEAIHNFWTDFRTFLAQGTAVDFGVGVIVGGMFSNITASLMADILSPPFELLLGRTLTNWFFVLKQGETPGLEYKTLEQAREDGAITENT